MGPRPDGRGKPGSCVKSGRRPSVNGAAARRPRKVAYGGQLPVRGPASMGPRPDGRGKAPSPAARASLPQSRQWGRGQTAAEREGTCVYLCQRRYASMGPRPDGRGKCLDVVRIQVHGLASMGPRPDGRGKPARGPRAPFPFLRQWGRGQTAAESAPLVRRLVPVVHASMGPRPDGRGKLPLLPAPAPTCSVNGAAARRPRKGGPLRTASRRARASMGPRPDGRGKGRPPRTAGRAPKRQWGRGQTAAESHHHKRPKKSELASMGPRPDGRGK